MSPGQRRSPGGETQAPSKTFGGVETSIPGLPLLSLGQRERELWLEGYQWGRVGGLDDGYARGYAACDEELSRLQREAHRVVLLMAGLDDHETATAKRHARQVEAANRIALEAKAAGW